MYDYIVRQRKNYYGYSCKHFYISAYTFSMADSIKSTSEINVHGQVVVNPDGSNIGSQLRDDDSLMLLRDIRKLLKASAYKDAGDRQIVKIGALGGISGGAEVTTTIPVSGTVTATVASTTITQAGTHDHRLLNYDMARVKYATGMRANLLLS